MNRPEDTSLGDRNADGLKVHGQNVNRKNVSGETSTDADSGFRSGLEEKVSQIEQRKIEARNLQHRSVWFGLGTFGLVGWSVTIPALLGIALGVWIDTRVPSRFSWTLMLMVLGVALGCFNAWRWVCRESQDEPKQ